MGRDGARGGPDPTHQFGPVEGLVRYRDHLGGRRSESREQAGELVMEDRQTPETTQPSSLKVVRDSCGFPEAAALLLVDSLCGTIAKQKALPECLPPLLALLRSQVWAPLPVEGCSVETCGGHGKLEAPASLVSSGSWAEPGFASGHQAWGSRWCSLWHSFWGGRLSAG